MAYNSTNQDRFKDYKFWSNRPLAIKKDYLHVIFIGTFTNSFDFKTVLDAARDLDNTEKKIYFTFCGNGYMHSHLKSTCKNLNNCDFVGWINSPQIQSALELADIGLAPYIKSNNFIYNVPNKPAEYMSGGLAIVTSLSIGALPDLLKKTNSGMIYSNKEQLIRVLSKLSEKGVFLNKMKLASRKVFKQDFNAKNVYTSLAHYLERL